MCFLAFNSAIVFAQTSSQNSNVKTENQFSNELSVVHQSGFSGFSDGFQQNVIDFNFQTNRFFFRHGVNLINPGIHHFTENTLIGVTSSGEEILLNNGNIQGGSIVLDVIHDTQIPNFSQFEYFRIDVSYHDTLWNQQRNAVMIFRLNLPTKIAGTMNINGKTYKWMEASYNNNRGFKINPGNMDYKFSPNPHDDPWYNKNQIKFYNKAADQIASQGNSGKWVIGNWPSTIKVTVNKIDYVLERQ